MPTFSIVVPVYNEAEFMPIGLPRLLADLDEANLDYRVLIMENGSTDTTAELARRAAGGAPVEVHSLPTPDYGAAMREGFLAATGDWIVNFDIDYFSADFLRRVLERADECDLVIASKRDPDSVDRRSPLRRTATAVFNLLLRSLFRSSVSDTHGMKAFRRDVIAELVPDVVSRQDLFDTELVIRAERAGHRIVEVPVVVEEMRPARSLLKRVPRTLRGMWLIRSALASDDRRG
ncbi:hypothetical protein BH23ACT5_BH23ACT5_13950 [soil metagenome]